MSRKRYRYTGQEKDDETGLGYHHHRYYVPWLGRWASADPAGLVDGGNRWAYSKNAPTHVRDLDGLQGAATSAGTQRAAKATRYRTASPDAREKEFLLATVREAAARWGEYISPTAMNRAAGSSIVTHTGSASLVETVVISEGAYNATQLVSEASSGNVAWLEAIPDAQAHLEGGVPVMAVAKEFARGVAEARQRESMKVKGEGDAIGWADLRRATIHVVSGMPADVTAHEGIHMLGAYSFAGNGLIVPSMMTSAVEMGGELPGMVATLLVADIDEGVVEYLTRQLEPFGSEGKLWADADWVNEYQSQYSIVDAAVRDHGLSVDALAQGHFEGEWSERAIRALHDAWLAAPERPREAQ